MDTENSLYKKFEEVKPGEKGGGEEDIEETVKEDAGALEGVAPGAGEAVNEDAGTLVRVASGAGEAMEKDIGTLVGVAAEA